MQNENDSIRISKFLSLVLRHKPETIGLVLDEQGWTNVDGLLAKIAAAGFDLDRPTLQHVVETNSKKRFAFSEDGTMIRASQGHSIDVNLGYAEKEPPAILFHGTAEKNVPAICKNGLQKQGRHHVHLSADEQTAVQVGSRHGKPVVFTVAAGAMRQEGFSFYQSANGVWLTDHVPPGFLHLL